MPTVNFFVRKERYRHQTDAALPRASIKAVCREPNSRAGSPDEPGLRNHELGSHQSPGLTITDAQAADAIPDSAIRSADESVQRRPPGRRDRTSALYPRYLSACPGCGDGILCMVAYRVGTSSIVIAAPARSTGIRSLRGIRAGRWIGLPSYPRFGAQRKGR